MNIENFFPYLKLRKNGVLSWYKKLNIYNEILFTSIVYFWLTIQFIYPLFFGYKYTYKNLTIYSNSKFLDTSKLYDNIDDAFKKLTQNNLYFKADENINIYLGNKTLFYLSMYPGLQFFFSDTLARTIYGEIFMRDLDAHTMQMHDKKDFIPFQEILSHELVHIWQGQNYAFIGKYLLMKSWISEGYAVYASDQSMPKVSTDEKIKNFLQEYHRNSKFIRKKGSYTLWYLIVKHAIEKMHKSVDDLHQGKVDYDEVLDSLLAEYSISK